MAAFPGFIVLGFRFPRIAFMAKKRAKLVVLSSVARLNSHEVYTPIAASKKVARKSERLVLLPF